MGFALLDRTYAPALSTEWITATKELKFEVSLYSWRVLEKRLWAFP